MRLERWIGASHLQSSSLQAYRWLFEGDRFRSIILDDFLLPERLEGLRALFAEDGRFEPFRGRKVHATPAAKLAGAKPFHEEPVPEEEAWGSVPEDDRLAHEEVLAGVRPGHELGHGWATHLRFRMLVRDEAFIGFLSAITGIRAANGFQWMPRIMRAGHFVRPHDDTGKGRRLCMVFFVGGGWRPGFDARFQNVVDGEPARSVEPIANRIIIHQPRIDQIHQVEPFAPAAGGWERWAYSIWMHGPDARVPATPADPCPPT